MTIKQVYLHPHYQISHSNLISQSTEPLSRDAQDTLFRDWSNFYYRYLELVKRGFSQPAAIASIDSCIVLKGKRAQTKLINANTRMVIGYVNRLFPESSIKDDLIAEGLLGLSYALLKFVPSKNTKFSSYAFFWVKQRVLSANDKYTKHCSKCISTNKLPEIESCDNVWDNLSTEEQELISIELPILACLHLGGNWDRYTQITQSIESQITLQTSVN